MTFQRDLAWQQIELTYKASVAHQFARYALALDYPRLPDNVVHQSKRCVLDALGCAIGAHDAPGRFICEETVKEFGGTEEATVFLSGMRTSVLNASLVNSFLVRFLDYSDVGGGGHNSDAISSLLAVAERGRASGRDFLTALVVSYELGARFREALTRPLEPKGWTSDVRAGLNQPPALGRLMGLNEEQIANAIGICLSHTLPLGILDAHREENVMAKNLRFGWAAHDAIIACALAKRGFTGPVRIVESNAGICGVVVGNEIDLEHLCDFSGWRILKNWFKAMPTNATTAAHVFCTLHIVKEQDLKPSDIAEVHIKAPPREAIHTTTPAKKYPRSAENADHSAHYANALAIKERKFGIESVDPKKFTDPLVLDLIERIRVDTDESLGRYSGACEIVTTDGRKFYKRIDTIHGHTDDPMSDRELEDKFREMAEPLLGSAHVNKMFDMIWSLENLDDVSKLVSMMVLPKAIKK